MENTKKSKEELLQEIVKLKQQVAEIEILGKNLADSKEKYNSIIENSNDLIQSVDKEGNFLFVNKTWKQKLGYSEDEVKEMNLFRIIHPDHIDHCELEFREVLDGKTAKDIQTVLITKSGNYVTVEGNIAPLMKDNKIIATHAFFRDVTEKKLAENSLADANLHLQTVFNHSHHTIIVATNSDGLITIFNTGAERMLGYTAKEMVGKQTPGLFHLKSELIARGKELSKEFGRTIEGFEVFKAPVTGGSYDEREWTFVRKDGTHFTGNLIVTAIKSDKGEFTGVIGFAQDITEKKQAEEEMNLVNEINKIANSGNFQNYILNTIAKIISKALNFQTTNIYHYNHENNFITLASMSLDSGLMRKIEKLSGITLLNLKIPLYEGSKFRELIQNKQTQLQDDPVQSIKDYTDKPILQAFAGPIAKIIGFKYGIRVPLMFNDKIIGIIGVTDDKKYTDKSIASLERFAAQLSLIINKVQIDELLRSSEEKFRAISTTATDGIIILNEKAETTFWNDAATKIFGFTSDEVLGNDLHTIIAPERYYEDYKKGFAKYLKTGKGPLVGGTREVMAQRKDGTEFPMEISMSSFLINNQFQAVGIVRDITQRKQESEKYKKLFESSSDALMVLSEKGYIDGNQATLDIFNIKSKDDFLLTQPWELSPRYQPDGRESKGKARQMIEQAYQKGSNRFEWTHRRKNGVDFPAEVLLTKTVIANKEVIQVKVTDLTERKKAEVELHNKQELNDKIQSIVLNFANEEINSEYKLQHFIEKILKAAYDLFKHDRLSIWLPDDKGFYLAAYEGNSENPEGLDFLSGHEFSNYLKFMKNNRLLISNDVNKDERLVELKDYFTVTGTHAMLDTSAVIEGETIAIFCNEKLSIHNWTTEEVSFMRTISEQLVSVYLRLEEQESQIKLKDSELKLSSFFNFAPIGIAINKMDGVFTKVNIEFSRITGYTAEELNKLSYWDLTPKEYAAREEIQLKNIAERKAYGPYEKEYISKSGIRVPVMLNGIIIQSGGEDFIWSVVEDISIRKQKEIEIINIAKELRLFIETANAPIFGIDVEGNVNEWNQTTEQITKYRKEEVIGKDLVEEFISEDYKTSVKNVLNQALQGKETANYEFPLYTKDKRRVIILLNASTRRDIDGKITGVLGIGQDITEMDGLRTELKEERKNLVKRIEERTAELSLSNAQLAKAAKMKDEFLASMSHELRTPLNSILGLSEALQEEVYGSLNPKQAKSLHNIESSGKHLLSLINEILDLAKIEAGKIELEYSKISFENIIQSSLLFIKQPALKKHLKITSSISSAVEYFSADEKRMKQILVNLLNNAVKFTPEGGEVSLEVIVNIEDKKIDFSVIDTGIGISSENLAQLFQAFVQIDSKLSREYEGTGLGLVLVKNLVELHNGAISVESEVNKGSCFTVSIPLIIEDLDGQKQETKEHILAPVKSEPIFEGSQLLVLLAEDNEANIETLTDYLEVKQFRVMVARNGEEAVEKASEIKPDIILMDIQMPVMDGLTAIKKIRAIEDKNLKGVPIIAITALAMPGDEEKCLNAGADLYVKKPLSLKKLVISIQDLLGKTKKS